MNQRIERDEYKFNFPLETIENLDTIYGAGLFFEFVDFFSERHRLLEFQIDESPNYFNNWTG